MTKTMLGCALALAALSANAKDKLVPLPVADASALQGKAIAITVYKRPEFGAMTAGKALAGGLFGAAAMYVAGSKLIVDNEVQDPAEIVRTTLAAGLRDAYAAQLLPVDTWTSKATRPKDIAAKHPHADYVLDVRTGSWMYSYYPVSWGTYWVGYNVQVQLVDTKTGTAVSKATCTVDTKDNPHPPSREALHADAAKLLKDVSAALGWTCVQRLAQQQFHLSADKVAATPGNYADPLATLAAGTAAAAIKVPAASAAPAAAAPAPAPAPETDVNGATPEVAPAPDEATADRG